MKSFLYRKRLSELFTVCGVATASALLIGCRQADVLPTSPTQYYTRGIGHYPGNPSENFAPILQRDQSHYRNLALNRMAFSSSSYDYNLTAQLATDGIITSQSPQYLELLRPDGEVPRREREWMLDRGPYSRNAVEGEDAFFIFSLKNSKAKATQVHFRGSLAFYDNKVQGGYEISCQGSDDGKNWTELGSIKGNGMPGKESRYKAHTDPNKNSWDPGVLPTRSLNETITFSNEHAYSYYRMNYKMKGAAYWSFYETDFYDGNQLLNLLPSNHFSSTWMSLGKGEEWVYVDLGATSDFDNIRLHWINKAVKGKIQVSDDASNWKELAILPEDSTTFDNIKVQGRGRYVRILMTEATNNGRYMLSEIEVWGKGGIIPNPAATPAPTPHRIALSGGNWKIQRASEISENGETLSRPDYTPTRWLAATVPGTVLSSYINAGAVPNPNYADQLMQISESFFNSNFWYRNEFEVPADFKQDHIFLNFDGINWKANVFVNGCKVGRLEGAFSRGIFDVTNVIVPGKNIIAVEIEKNANIGAVKEKFEKNTDFNGGILGADNPTFHATVGWDWISTIRGRNIGIWNDVYLTSKGKVTLQDPFVQTTLNLPDTTQAVLTPEIAVTNHENIPVEGVLSGKIGNIDFEQKIQLKAHEKRTVRFDPDNFTQLILNNPKLWWPKGYGAPHLYDATFSFAINGETSDAKHFKVGIRQMTYNEDNHVLSLYINGRRFICRGGNWGFSESNLNYRNREYDAAVAYHADMNFTMLRNWVGQIGDEELYEACDRYGILVWQDFWLANPSDGPDPTDESLFMANASDYVKRIRNHPSIGLYCGRNEGYPPETLDAEIRKMLKTEHPDIHYISSSADDVVSGHGPYRALPASEYFSIKNGNDKFHSERGMPNVMNYESLVRTFSPDALWPQNAQWGQHDYTQEGAQSCASFNSMIERGFGKPHNAKEFADLAQWINYDGYRAMFESRSKYRKGLLLWMTHPCWPTMVWQTYDYYLDPTAAYFGCKKACEPLHIQWNPITNSVEVVNYSAGHHAKLRVHAQVINMNGTLAWEKEAVVDSHEDTTLKPLQLEFKSNLSAVHYIRLRLIEEGQTISDNFYLRGTEEGNYQALKELPQVKLVSDIKTHKTKDGQWSATVRVSNPSSTPALFIRLNTVGQKDGLQILPMFYSDNYFSLMPNEEKTINLHWKDVDTRGEQPHIDVSGYNVK